MEVERPVQKSRSAAKLLTKDEAQRIAADFTTLKHVKTSCAIQRGNAKKNGRLRR
jgi:hypothetical protein